MDYRPRPNATARRLEVLRDVRDDRVKMVRLRFGWQELSMEMTPDRRPWSRRRSRDSSSVLKALRRLRWVQGLGSSTRLTEAGRAVVREADAKLPMVVP